MYRIIYVKYLLMYKMAAIATGAMGKIITEKIIQMIMLVLFNACRYLMVINTGWKKRTEWLSERLHASRHVSVD